MTADEALALTRSTAPVRERQGARRMAEQIIVVDRFIVEAASAGHTSVTCVVPADLLGGLQAEFMQRGFQFCSWEMDDGKTSIALIWDEPV